MESVDLLFEPELKFAERGSKILWRTLKDKCRDLDVNSSVKEFDSLLKSLFKDITGYNINNENYVYVEALDNKKGISSGMVFIPWWRIVGFPVLLKRFEEKKSPYTNEEHFTTKMRDEIHEMVERYRWYGKKT